MGLEADRAIRSPTAVSARPLVLPGAQATARDPLLLTDAADTSDLLGAAEAVRPLAELCLAPEAQTPFLVGIVGPSGTGKSFALRRLAGAIESLAAAAARTPGGPFQSQIVVATLDAAGVSGDPASALASAAFVALERDRAGANYSALADEAAHAATDPHRAASAAAERHDEIVRRLDAERSARDEVEAKRARLSEALLYETPGSRVDSFIRTSRATIEGRLRRFGLAEGDAGAGFRDLVRELASLGAASRLGIVLRAMWAYRGQLRLLTLAAIAFLLAFAVNRIQQADAQMALRALSESLAPVANWLAAHSEALDEAVEALIAIGLIALFANVWRAVRFSTLLFRGLRLLNIDVRERRRELDASGARLERRVMMLSAEADAASKRADAMAKRAGGGGPSVSRAPGPVFLKALETPARASQQFFAELSRLMVAPGATNLPCPRRLLFVIDNLEALPPGEAALLVEAAHVLLGAGCAAVIACDPAILAPKSAGAPSPRAWERNLFQVVFDASTLTKVDSGRLAARLMASGALLPSLGEIDASRSAVAEPLSPGETALLTALAPLIEGSPRALKRFHNAYRLARLAKAPRPLVALTLAALLSPDPELARRLRETLLQEGDRLEDPPGPENLIAAMQVARAAEGKPFAKTDARSAWDATRRYAPTYP